MAGLTEICVFCNNIIPGKHPTNGDRLRSLTNKELAEELTQNPPIPCRVCEYWDRTLSICQSDRDFVCTTGYAEALALNWLNQLSEEPLRGDHIRAIIEDREGKTT